MNKILSGLASGQVLQRLGSRGANVTLHFLGDVAGPVLVTISGVGGRLRPWKKRRVEFARQGGVRIRVENIPAGGPYCLRIECGAAVAEVKPFFVGDVWLLAGQSNMEGVGDMAGRAKSRRLIRAFSMRREWRLAADPLHVCGESPDACHSFGRPLNRDEAENVRWNARKGVGPGIFFAREMLGKSGVPQGLICAAHGGTAMSQWNPARKDADSLYGSMLASVRATGQPVAGVLWYQGESDANATAHGKYSVRMKAFIAATRRDLRQPRLPWLLCQIGRVHGHRDASAAYWNSIQDQQRKLPSAIADLDVVASVDLPLDDFIHIGSAGAPILARRLALAADRLVYRSAGSLPAPRLHRIRSFSVAGSQRIEVRFAKVKGLRAAGEPGGFTLLDAKGTVLPLIFKTTLEGGSAILHLTEWMPEGARLCYGHGYAPVCNITDSRGHALPVFGPEGVQPGAAWTPFVTSWKVSAVVSNSDLPLRDLEPRHLDRYPMEPRTYGSDGFVNEHPRWEHKDGQAYFTTKIRLPEAMSLDVLMGYDGPFRLWIDGEPFFTDLAGTNPCIRDRSGKKIDLRAGVHRLQIAMDLNGGLAWGFFLRFRRRGVSRRQIASGAYAKPCLVTSSP